MGSDGTGMRYVGLGALSAAVLLLELTLTRIYSVTQGYHFAFLAVSLGLFGFGASGTALFVAPRLWIGTQYRLLGYSALLFTLTALGSYWAVNLIPFDAYRLVLEPSMFLYLALFYLAPVVPFFFAGLALGGAISLDPGKAGGLYGASLIGSGIGAPMALVGPATWGPAGALWVVVTLGALAWVAFTWGPPARRRALFGGFGAVLVLLGLWLPGAVELRFSPYKALPQVLQRRGSDLVGTHWNPFSRLDVVRSEGLHQAPGLSLTYTQALPPQAALTTDGDNLTSLTSTTPQRAVFTQFLPGAVAFDLLQEPRVLVVEPGGGQDVLMALHHGAAGVTALVGNPLEAELLTGKFSDDVRGLFADSRVRVVSSNPRAYLRREAGQFDLVVLSLRDAFRPVTAGAYSLSENHLYSKEAFREYLRHLAPGGLLMATRWVQTPPSEELRLAATVVEALEESGIGDPADKLAALRTLQTLTLIVKKEPFTPAQVRTVRDFAASRQFDLSYLPGLGIEGTNRFFVLPEEYYFTGMQRMLDPEQRSSYYRERAFDVTPTTDDRPFFFHFFKWRQVPLVLARLGQAWQPFGGAGFLVVLAFLVVSVAASAAFILVPLAARRVDQAQSGRGSGPTGWIMLVYFFSLGLGFLWLEVPLMQRFILLLDHPTYSFGVVLFAVLVFSGAGSLCSPRLGRFRSWAILALAILASVYALGTDWILHAVLGLPMAGRVLVSILTIAPLAFLMGVPFPSGIALLRDHQPALIPWAWGTNGYASVVGAMAAALIALTWGFSKVMLASAGVYLLAWAALMIAMNLAQVRQPEGRSGPDLD